MSLLPPEKLLQEHINKGKQANKQEAKLLVLSSLLDNIFGVKIDELIPGIEKNLKSKILGVKGSADLIFSNVVIEIKLDIEKEMDDARRELIKYLQSLLEDQPNRRHIGVVTDVIRYKAFLPVIKNDTVVDLKEIGSIDMTKVSPADGIFWLDSFLFSKSGIRPTADDLKWRFGPASPTYGVTIEELTLLWKEIQDREDVKLKMSLWAKNMQIVYGSEPEVRVFIDHTYLVTLVKLIIYLRLSGSKDVSELSIFKALSGEYFSSYGITNLIEEDFFSWILDPRVGNMAVKLFLEIAKELLRYDISQIDEDLFKEIYQEIVERGERHRIGEYYTPEWLTELTINEAIQEWKKKNRGLPRILDPACGSGTFLVNCIRLLADMRKKISIDKTLSEVLSSVVGVDVNPLAVIIAKSNYIIALGDLMQSGRNISIPVFISDSVKIPTIVKTTFGATDVYDFSTNGNHLQLPVRVVSDRRLLGEVLDAIKVATMTYRKDKNRKEVYGLFKKRTSKLLSSDEDDVLQITLDTLMQLIDKQLDSIWIFMLNNVYAPIALKEKKFDIIISNPPWIAMRYIEDSSYQDFLKEKVLDYELLDKDQVNLFTHMEMATFFFCRTADLYLQDTGIIAFVMPRSILTGAFHHAKFKELNKPRMKLLMILDMEDVAPLFNVPCCVIISVLDGKTTYPVSARRYKGKLDRKNERLSDATEQLKVEDYMYEPAKISGEYSYYHDKVKEGATIVPRSLWFIDFDMHPTLGINLSNPKVRTSGEVANTAKKPWTDIALEGNVESEFIYGTLLGGDLVPFGFAKMRPVVLPIEPLHDSYRLLDVKDLRGRGSVNMSNWLENAQKLWEQRRTEKAVENFPRLIERLDYQKLMTVQNPKIQFVVLYTSTGTNLVSCVIKKKQLPVFHFNRVCLTLNGFIADYRTHFYETTNEDEAYYLCAVLNSRIVNVAIKPLQTRGLFGERDIERRPLMLPIPKFNNKITMHKNLSKLGKDTCKKVSKIRFAKTRPSGLRKEASDALQNELKQIDGFVKKLLNIR